MFALRPWSLAANDSNNNGRRFAHAHVREDDTHNSRKKDLVTADATRARLGRYEIPTGSEPPNTIRNLSACRDSPPIFGCCGWARGGGREERRTRPSTRRAARAFGTNNNTARTEHSAYTVTRSPLQPVSPPVARHYGCPLRVSTRSPAHQYHCGSVGVVASLFFAGRRFPQSVSYGHRGLLSGRARSIPARWRVSRTKWWTCWTAARRCPARRSCPSSANCSPSCRHSNIWKWWVSAVGVATLFLSILYRGLPVPHNQHLPRSNALSCDRRKHSILLLERDSRYTIILWLDLKRVCGMLCFSKIDVDLLSLSLSILFMVTVTFRVPYTFSDNVTPLPWPVSPYSKYISSTISS